MEKSSCLKSTVNFIANFEWVKNRVLLSSGPMVISLTFLSASAVSSGTCTSSPHPSLKNMSARAHRGMAKACFTVTKSPVNNLNGSQWMSPALSRDDTIQRQVPINFSWASEGLVGRSVLWNKRKSSLSFPIPPPSADQHLFQDFSHCLSHDECCLLTIRRHSSWDDEAWEREQKCRRVRCLSARRYCLALIHVRRREKTLLSSFMPN